MKRLPLTLLAAALLGSRPIQAQEHSMADMEPPTHSGEAAGSKIAAGVGCDLASFTDEAIAKHNEAAAATGAFVKPDYPNLIWLPGAESKGKAVLCPASAAWSILRGIPKRADLFRTAKTKESQLALLKDALAEEKELTAKLAVLKEKAATVHRLSEAFVKSVVEKPAGADKPKRYETNLSAAKQKEVLNLLLEQTGAALVGPREPNAPRPASVKGGAAVKEYYKAFKDFTEIAAVKESVKSDWSQFVYGGANNDPDNQIVGREAMRCIYYSDASGDADFWPVNAKFGALNNIAPELGRGLRAQFYALRADLNAANEAGGKIWKTISNELKAGLIEASKKEEKARQEEAAKLKEKRSKISGMLADKLFDGSEATQEDRDLVAAAIAQRTTVDGKNVTFTVIDKDKKKQTISIPESEVKSAESLAQNPKFQSVVDLLKQDKKISAIAGAVGLAVNPPKEDVPPAKPVDAGQPPNLTVAPKASDLSPDQQKMLAAAKAGGPGCTTNTQDKYAANEKERIADEASKRVRDGKDADKNLDRAQKDLEKAQKKSDAKADDDFKAAMAPYEKLKAANKINAADYQAALDKQTASRAQAKASNLQAYNDGMDKANAAAVDAVTKAGTEKTIGKWRAEQEAKIKGDVDFLYDQEIKSAAPGVQKKFGSDEGRKALDPDLAKFDPSGFIPAYLAARWGTPPAASGDAKRYIRDYNEQYPLSALEVEPGVHKFVPVDFQKWLTEKQADMAKQGQPAKPNIPAQPPAQAGEAKRKADLDELRKKIDGSK